jgi:hypothetical protein
LIRVNVTVASCSFPMFLSVRRWGEVWRRGDGFDQISFS